MAWAQKSRVVGILVFPQFEPLDVFGPVEAFVIANRAKVVEVLASVRTGAALLARAGVLSGLEATTNRRAFDWVVSVSPTDVSWDRTRRWVDAGRVITSAGVSAGTDMALHLVARLLGDGVARTTAARMEYRWERPTV